MVHRCLGVLIAVVLVTSCNTPPPPPSSDLSTEARSAKVDDRVKAFADGYLDGYFQRNPDAATYYGIAGTHHDRLPDNSLAALKAWEAKEDAWLTEAKAIDPDTIRNESLKATYAITREALESAVGARVCRSELWSVSQTAGWQVNLGFLVTIQPVGTDQARKEAIARWSSLATYLDTEIENLREGLRLKYSSPKHNVQMVIDQMNVLIKGTGADQPFLSPATRDKAPEFQKEYRAAFKTTIIPAIARYRDFLVKEYLPAARETVAVADNPDGLACYDAAVRLFSSVPIAAKDVHALGLAQMDAVTKEMQAIAESSFHTSDVPALLKSLRTDRRYLFKSREELIAYSQAALARAKGAAPSAFGILPTADVGIEPYPKFREKDSIGEYNAPAEDGSRPGLFYISAYQAEKKSRLGAESTAFHETIPGHHLQQAIAIERTQNHPIGRYIFNSGFAEGWALYSEALADELKLYSSDVDRLGRLSSQAFRAARLVVDSGIHTMGWTRQQAIDYMLAHTSEAPADVSSEIDRYIVWPGQATAYMLGMLEIRKARDEAERQMGSRFDLKAFHDRVLEDGGVPLTFLTNKVRRWASATNTTQ
jgi:uncharacterized protein (DUF885 family)